MDIHQLVKCDKCLEALGRGLEVLLPTLHLGDLDAVHDANQHDVHTDDRNDH